VRGVGILNTEALLGGAPGPSSVIQASLPERGIIPDGLVTDPRITSEPRGVCMHDPGLARARIRRTTQRRFPVGEGR
jgi:hypothetical protein